MSTPPGNTDRDQDVRQQDRAETKRRLLPLERAAEQRLDKDGTGRRPRHSYSQLVQGEKGDGFGNGVANAP